MNNSDLVPGFDEEVCFGVELRLKALEGLEACLVIGLKGYLDTQTSPAFLRKVLLAIDGGYRRIVLDCPGLEYVSSTGIGSLSAILKKLRALNGDMVILNCHPKPLATIEMMGFRQFFAFVDSLEAAKAHFLKVKATEAGPVFPRRFSCPICNLPHSVPAPGPFRCPDCETRLIIGEAGEIHLG